MDLLKSKKGLDGIYSIILKSKMVFMEKVSICPINMMCRWDNYVDGQEISINDYTLQKKFLFPIIYATSKTNYFAHLVWTYIAHW